MMLNMTEADYESWRDDLRCGGREEYDNQLIGMRSPFGPAEDRPLHEASYVGMKHAFEALGGKYKVDRHGSHRLFLLGISSQGFDYYTED